MQMGRTGPPTASSPSGPGRTHLHLREHQCNRLRKSCGHASFNSCPCLVSSSARVASSSRSSFTTVTVVQRVPPPPHSSTGVVCSVAPCSFWTCVSLPLTSNQVSFHGDDCWHRLSSWGLRLLPAVLVLSNCFLTRHASRVRRIGIERGERVPSCLAPGDGLFRLFAFGLPAAPKLRAGNLPA